MKRALGFMGILVILLVISFLRRGLDPPAPNPPGSFSFGVMGDAPYNVLEEAQFRLVLRDLDAHDLSTVISVGDIFWRPCSDEMYARARDQFNGLRHPVVYTPGDNEWFDCWEPGSGGYEPQERLARLRQIFYTSSTRHRHRVLVAGGLPLPVNPSSSKTCDGQTTRFSSLPFISSAAGTADRPFRIAPRTT